MPGRVRTTSRSSSSFLRTSSAFVLALGLVGSAVPANAAPRAPKEPAVAEDTLVANELQKIVATDVIEANFGSAKRRLAALVERCGKKPGNCAPATLANVHVMIGIVAVKTLQSPTALASFASALEADPTVDLPGTAKSEDATRKLFAEARAEYDAKHPSEDPYHVTWENREAAFLFVDAMAVKKKGDHAACVEKIRTALDKEDNPAARLHLADCLDAGGRVVDALREAVAASEKAAKDQKAALVTLASERTQAIMKRLGRVKLEIPSTFQNLRVTFDERSVPQAKWATPSVVDPGEHRVRVEGVIAGTIMSDDQTVNVTEGETVLVKISPVPRAVAPGQLDCIRSATTEQQLQACVQKAPSRLTVRANAEFSAYTDTQRVTVYSPALSAQISAPTNEWSVGGSYLVDVVSAASADVVATASPRFKDTRHAGTLNGSYAFAPWTFMVNGALSSESDYLSRGIHGAVSLDTFEKQFTPKIGYGITLDKIGRAGTPYEIFSNDLTTHDVEATGTLILSRTSLLVVGAAFQFEYGDQSKPYRYIPTFAPGTNVPNHASADYVNAVRLPERPLEQLPLERDRYAILGKFISRIRENATLRLEERFYTDNWGMFASTTTGRYLVDLNTRLRVWAGLRLHFQTATSFYTRAYYAEGDSQGVVRLPIVRTTDRELGTVLSPSPMLGGRISLTPPESKYSLGLTIQGNLLYSHYFDALYTSSRTAIYGTTGIDFEWL